MAVLDLLLPVMPFRLERGLVALLAAALVWLLVQLLARTLLRRQPWRDLAQTSSLSICSTVLAIGLTSWLLGLVPPQARLSILSTGSLHTFLLCDPLAGAGGAKAISRDILDILLGTSVLVLWVLAALGILGVPVTVLATLEAWGLQPYLGARGVVSNSLTGFSCINKPLWWEINQSSEGFHGT